MDKKWQFAVNNKKHEFKENFGLPDFLLQLLYNRGLKSQKQIQEFFNPQYENLHDPFLFNDMQKAVSRILLAVKKKEKIMIYGDYDADGVTSSAIVYKTLKLLTDNVQVYIPHREKDGYGLNKKAIEKFSADKINLLITVDCGVTNIEEVDLANKNKIDVIITDHHEQLDNLPKALAVIDPKVKTEKYPCKVLAGAAVAYKLATAVLLKADISDKKLKKVGGKAGFLKWLLDLVGIGTIADVVPLLEENRILAKFGLIVLQQTNRFGLLALAKAAGLDLKNADAYTVGYQIAPRLNAAGRLAHAQDSFNLLVTEDEKEAWELGQALQKINSDRQKVTDLAILSAKKQLQEQIENKFLFVFEKTIQAGVVGLVAGRLCDEYYRPIMVMTKVKEKIVGSGRSIEHFNIVESLFRNEDLLSRYGGHAQACGFTLAKNNDLQIFQDRLLKIAQEKLADIELKPTLNIDAQVNLQELNFQLVELLEQFEPFGECNLQPLFLLERLQITAMDFLGEKKNHLRLMVKQDDSALAQKILGFGLAKKWGTELQINDYVDAIVQVSKNIWNGRESAQIKIVDLRKSDL